MNDVRKILLRDLLAFIEAPNPRSFEQLANRVVAWQIQTIEPYGRLLQSRGEFSGHWKDVPLLPTELFREMDLCSSDNAVATFCTSGTTGRGEKGVRRVPDLALYHAGMIEPFLTWVLAGDPTRRPWINLIPHPQHAPDSSLSHMVEGLAQRFSNQSCHWCITPSGVDVDACKAAMLHHTDHGEPVVVMTTAFALVHLLDGLRMRALELPHGSRMMLTGGFKTKSRTLDESELLERIEDHLGLTHDVVIPEFGMTELTSQAYGRPFTPPEWLKFWGIHPETGDVLAPGEKGLIACFDLLNLDNISAILTDDLGVVDDAGRLCLHGRLPGATPRGCSLTAEAWGTLKA